jgi:alpha-L-fucosidase 2
MLAIFPGRQIHPSTAPEFAKAAKVSMEARGNGRTGWSKVFKACVYARLYEAEHSYELIADVLQTKCHGNLWTTHPPFQIDANFGYAAAVNEMLAQSHAGQVHLLPALPKAWPEGEVKGMRLRGGFELDMKWADGKLLEAEVRNIASPDGTFRVQYKGATKEFKIDQGQPLALTAAMLVK